MHPYKYMNFLNQNVFKLRCLGKFFLMICQRRISFGGKQVLVLVILLACLSFVYTCSLY